MRCKRAKRYLSCYLSNELSSSRKKRIAAHLEECPACREELAGLRRTSDLVRSLDRVGPPPDLLTPLMEELARGRRFSLPRLPMRSLVPATLLLLFLFFVGISYLKSPSPLNLLGNGRFWEEIR